MPRPHFTPGKDPVPILQEAGWAPGQVWTGEKSRPYRDSVPDPPARSQSLYALSYPAHMYEGTSQNLKVVLHSKLLDVKVYWKNTVTLHNEGCLTL